MLGNQEANVCENVRPCAVVCGWCVTPYKCIVSTVVVEVKPNGTNPVGARHCVWTQAQRAEWIRCTRVQRSNAKPTAACANARIDVRDVRRRRCNTACRNSAQKRGYHAQRNANLATLHCGHAFVCKHTTKQRTARRCKCTLRSSTAAQG